MIKTINLFRLLVIMIALPVAIPGALADVRLGLGVNYWKTLDDIKADDFDEDGLSWIISAQFGLTEWSKLELAVERFDKGFGGATKEVYAPQAFIIIGKGIYAGAGVGGYYSDGDWSSDPFFALRAGINFEILPSLFLDINANYRFESWDDLSDEGKNIDSDTVTLGAAVRIEF
ncbi:MAG TPA: hypothetical protein PJ991_10105 [Kiritimatiellia bacterium]|nr:hypothetical protein [Kiritimatiellia bacterium]